jgi:hypothetical protein
MEASRREATECDKLLAEKLKDYARQTFDVESGALQQQQQQASESEIARLFDRLGAAIERMEQVGGNSTAGRAHVARFRAICHEHQVDWNKASSAARHAREHQALLKSTERLMSKEKDTTADATRALYESEQRGIRSSMRLMEENISHAMGVQDALKAQAERLRGAGQGLASMGENIPGINVLIRAAGKKKTRDNMIVATVIATCLCLTFWWVL